MEAIPLVEDPKRYDVRDFLDSEFVELKTNEAFTVRMQYPLLKMENAEGQCFLRKEVCHKLFEAAALLPKGYRFQVLDAWRPFSLQEELHDLYSKKIIDDFGLGKCSEEEKAAVIRKFVSEPVRDREVPPVHTTGGAVDLTLIGPDGAELEMGTAFDAFTDKTHTDYFEKEKSGRVRENRRLLYHVMTSVGFTNLPSEWWHYDYGDWFWGYYKKKAAIYRGVFTKEELLQWPGMRDM